MKIKRLKISQQLILVFFIGVILPLCITAFIVTNVNQHAVRAELKYSAMITMNNVYQRFEKSFEEKKQALLYIAEGTKHIKSENKIKEYLRDIAALSDEMTQINIIKTDENITGENKENLFINTAVEIFTDSENHAIAIYVKLSQNNYLRELIGIEEFKNDLFKYLANDKRQVYITDSENNIIMSFNENETLFKEMLDYIPETYEIGKPAYFHKIKNEPNVFLKLENPERKIIVLTPKHLTRYGIIDARNQIILTILLSALSIIVFGVLYSYSLNTNITQLFKAISAIGKGNYRRKVRLIRDFFTPYEFVFLMAKFNDMAQKINEGYEEINEANKKLSKLDNLKSNLIDTVSHEFRTPLTCIKGYTSSLLRNDVNLSDEVKIKSLKVIKQQTERLSRLVDDLLVVPEIESEFLRIFPTEVDLKDVFENTLLSVHKTGERTINLDIPEEVPLVYADADRVFQIAVNLVENAMKYSPENSEINIKVFEEGDFVKVKIKNESEPISEDKLQKLFDKFSRIEDDLRRTTRGTGLGLFIVRGLVHAMKGEISLSSEDGFEVTFTLPLISS